MLIRGLLYGHERLHLFAHSLLLQRIRRAGPLRQRRNDR